MDNKDLLLDTIPQTRKEALQENWETISYHYKRLGRMAWAETKRGMRKPKSGKRYIAPMTEHEKNFLTGKKQGIWI